MLGPFYITTLIALAIILAYLLFERIKFGEQESISATAYNAKWNAWLFSITMFLTAGLLWPQMIEMGGEFFGFLAFFICGALCFVGVTPHYKTTGGEVHYTAAYIMAGASQVWVFMTYWPALFAWIILGLAALKGRSIAWWSEIVCMVSLFISLLQWKI